MTDRAALEELAVRVEALQGPDREVDALIHRALNPDQPIMTDGGGYGPKARPVQYTRLGDLEMNDWADAANIIGAPLITASIDAAMSLVPEEHAKCWAAGWAIDGTAFATVGFDPPIYAATPPLALTAACLRSIAGKEG